MTIADFEQRLEEVLRDAGDLGGDRLGLEWDTASEAKQLKARIAQLQKQLRLIKRDVNAAKKVINTSYAAEIAKVTGRNSTSTKSRLRQRRGMNLQPYEELVRRIDQVLARLDNAKLEIDTWIANPDSPKPSIAITEQPVDTVNPLRSGTVAGTYDIAPITNSTASGGRSPQHVMFEGQRAVGIILGWFFATVFGLFALLIADKELLDALAFIGLALLCMPPFARFLTRQGHLNPKSRLAFLAAGLIFVNLTPKPTPITVVSAPRSAPPPVVSVAPSPVASPSTAIASPSPSPSVVAQAIASDRTAAIIVSTGDGDTLQATVNGQGITVRLACVDAPESVQPQGREAADRLRQLLPRNTPVELRKVDIDRYNRTVAEVYKNGRSIDLQLVREGHAVVYRDYLADCPNSAEYLAAEATAQAEELAFWSQSDPIMPWNWRRGDRPAPSPAPVASPSPTPSVASNCDPSYPDICIPVDSGDLDCGDIDHSGFAVTGSDPHRFDRDKDGIGCES